MWFDCLCSFVCGVWLVFAVGNFGCFSYVIVLCLFPATRLSFICLFVCLVLILCSCRVFVSLGFDVWFLVVFACALGLCFVCLFGVYLLWFVRFWFSCWCNRFWWLSGICVVSGFPGFWWSLDVSGFWCTSRYSCGLVLSWVLGVWCDFEVIGIIQFSGVCMCGRFLVGVCSFCGVCGI